MEISFCWWSQVWHLLNYKFNSSPIASGTCFHPQDVVSDCLLSVACVEYQVAEQIRNPCACHLRRFRVKGGNKEWNCGCNKSQSLGVFCRWSILCSESVLACTRTAREVLGIEWRREEMETFKLQLRGVIGMVIKWPRRETDECDKVSCGSGWLKGFPIFILCRGTKGSFECKLRGNWSDSVLFSAI